MKTQSYNYNQAIKELEKYKDTCTIEEIKTMLDIPNGEQIDTQKHNDEEWRAIDTLGKKYNTVMIDIINEIRRGGAYAYNSTVCELFCKRCNIEDTKQNHYRINSIVYNTQRFLEATKLIEKYQDMFEKGFIHSLDITPDMDGKKASLVGNIQRDWLTTHKDEVVTLVYKDGRTGYKKPRMRTRYYVFGLDNDLFIKLV